MLIASSRYASKLSKIRSQVWVCILGLLCLSGCNSVWFDPYIDLPDRELKQDYSQTGNFPQLLNSALETEKARRTARSYREQLAVGRSVLGYAAFGAAGAGGVAALYGAHRDLVLGLGVGAVGSYGAGSLFASADRVDIYSAANRALNCVVAAADSVMATAKSFGQLTTGSGAYLVNKASLDALSSQFSWPDDLHDKALLASKQYEAALDNFDTFKALDAGFAVTANKARDLILFAMEQKIRETQPGLETILQTAQGIAGAGVAYTKSVTPPKRPTIKPARALPEADPADKASLISLTERVSDAASKLNNALTSATNGMDQLGSVCVLDLPSITPLSVSQTDVTIGAGQQATIQARGGKLPLLTSWQGEVPEVDVVEVGRTIVLVGKTGLPSNEEYDLLVRDSLAAPGEVLIKVKTP